MTLRLVSQSYAGTFCGAPTSKCVVKSTKQRWALGTQNKNKNKQLTGGEEWQKDDEHSAHIKSRGSSSFPHNHPSSSGSHSAPLPGHTGLRKHRGDQLEEPGTVKSIQELWRRPRPLITNTGRPVRKVCSYKAIVSHVEYRTSASRCGWRYGARGSDLPCRECRSRGSLPEQGEHGGPITTAFSPRLY